jgi:hypothetical protein
MEIPTNLKDEIWNYCRVNNITNIDEFTLKLLKQGFTVEKYGATPVSNQKIIEKIVEKIVEVPVEKIVEIAPVDLKLSEGMKEHLVLIARCQEELKTYSNLNAELTKQLEIEQKKNQNKQDLYGER